jgi:hypothetical protein
MADVFAIITHFAPQVGDEIKGSTVKRWSAGTLKQQEQKFFFQILKSYIFWNITPCNPLKINQHFRRTFLSLQYGTIRQARNQHETPISAGFFLFDPEDGGDMLLRNVCGLLTDYMALYPGS